jgi:hypothetical protein
MTGGWEGQFTRGYGIHIFCKTLFGDPERRTSYKKIIRRIRKITLKWNLKKEDVNM